MPKGRPIYVGGVSREYMDRVTDQQEWVMEKFDVDPAQISANKLINEIQIMKDSVNALEAPPEGVEARRWPIRTQRTASNIESSFPEDYDSRPYTDIQILQYRHERMKGFLEETEKSCVALREIVVGPDASQANVEPPKYDPKHVWDGNPPKTTNISPYIEHVESMTKLMGEGDVPCPICGCAAKEHEYEEREGDGFDVLVAIKCTACGKGEGIWKREGF